jgi:hypothetical protein
MRQEMKRLEAEKKRATREENYSQAKRVKQAIDELQEVQFVCKYTSQL